MAVEIERKFLLKSDAWRVGADGVPVQGIRFRQGYVPSEAATVRVRLEGERGVLTLKSRGEGITRLEFEYEIPAADALQMLEQMCDQAQIDKRRYRVHHGAHLWEIDEFLGANAGLVVAEIELGSEDEAFERPAWLGEEVTSDIRYLNVKLAATPWTTWADPASGG